MKRQAPVDPDLTEALSALAGMVAQHCESGAFGKSEYYTSGFLSYDARAIRLLIKYRIMKKVRDNGGRDVTASFIKARQWDWA